MDDKTDFQGRIVDNEILLKLEQRLGRLHARQRLGIERDHEAQIFGQGTNFFHIENWYSASSVIRTTLKLTGLYWRARRNAERILVTHNEVSFKELPPLFGGFTILHISDLHVEMNGGAMRHLIALVDGLKYDLCVLTGDYRGQTFGPFDASLQGVASLRVHLRGPVIGVLGNHDTIQMVPGLEALGIRMLLNECETIVRNDERIYLAGIDDAHYFQSRQHRKGGIGHTERRVLDPAVPYARSLSAGGPCRFQFIAKRAYARGADLPAGVCSGNT